MNSIFLAVHRKDKKNTFTIYSNNLKYIPVYFKRDRDKNDK